MARCDAVADAPAGTPSGHDRRRGAKETAKARLRLVEEFHQDGFFQFSIPDDSVKIVPLPNGGREVNGMAQVVPHGGIRA